MVAIKLPVFAGMVPSIDPHLLSDQHAAYSENAWLYSGALVGYPAMAEIHEMANPAALIAFRIPTNESDPTYLFESFWVEFENPNTDFISAPIANDQFERFYWASSSDVPRYNTKARILAGNPSYLLGLPVPTTVLVTPSGGSSATLVSRAYVTTLVTEYGEEGPTSPAVLVNGKIDDTFTVTLGGVSAADLGVNRNIKKIRLYRTVTSSQGTATYYLVAERNAQTATQTVADTATDAVIASKPILESTAWTAPPSLDGIVTMPNGIMAGFMGNELWFSEPYRPHAWPAAYSMSVDHDIVGLAVIGQTLVVCTTGNPVTASGVNPASITTSKLAAFEPCLSRGSILPTEAGVYYTSPNGLILVNAGYVQNLTQQYISRDQWLALANAGKVNAGRIGSSYYAFGTSQARAFQDGVFQVDAFQYEDIQGAGKGFAIDPTNQNVGFSFLSDEGTIRSIRNDVFSGEMLLVKDGKVYWLDQRPGYSVRPYVWKSKIFQPPVLKNFAAFKVYFYEDPNRTFLNAPNYSIGQVFDPDHQLGVVRVFADGRLVLVHEIRKSGELHRLPSGFKAHFWQVEFEATVRLKSFQMATSVKELSVV